MNNEIIKKIEFLYKIYIQFNENDFLNNDFDLLDKKYLSKIKKICFLYKNLLNFNNEILSLSDLLDDDSFSKLALEEKQKIENKIIKIKQQILDLFINTDNECIIEIRPGVGGLESNLFLKNLFDLYKLFILNNKFNLEILDYGLCDIGYKYLIFKVIGKYCYEKFKYESGCHRVQRIPKTENKGRIHTSTVLVAVIKNNEVNVLPDLNLKDLKIDTYKSSGAGGQHVNKTESAIRIKHIPSGIVVECQDERSQHKNKSKALNLLKIKIKTMQETKEKNAFVENKKKLLGTGDRAYKVRTYNFIQDRLTDHRINKSYSLLHMLQIGNLNIFYDSLKNLEILDYLNICIDILKKIKK